MSKPKSTYVVRVRKGRPVEVDTQILRWRARGGPKALSKAVSKTLPDAPGCPRMDSDGGVEGEVAAIASMFAPEGE